MPCAACPNRHLSRGEAVSQHDPVIGIGIRPRPFAGGDIGGALSARSSSLSTAALARRTAASALRRAVCLSARLPAALAAVGRGTWDVGRGTGPDLTATAAVAVAPAQPHPQAKVLRSRIPPRTIGLWRPAQCSHGCPLLPAHKTGRSKGFFFREAPGFGVHTCGRRRPEGNDIEPSTSRAVLASSRLPPLAHMQVCCLFLP